MKRIFILTAILVVFISSNFSQSVSSTYFLNEWSQRHTLNPSFAPEYDYFSLPVLGGIEVGINTNTGLSNYLYKIDPSSPLYSQYKFNTFLDLSVDANQFLNSIPSKVSVNQSLKLNLLSLGFYTSKNSFWTFDIYLKENLDLYIPKDFFRLAKLGMTNSILNNNYDLKNLSMEQTNLLQFSLGYSREINSKLRVGINAKLLSGLSKEKINYSQFDINLSQSQSQINAVGEAYIMSNFISIGKDVDNNYDFSKITTSTGFKTAGFGAALDLGITYKPTQDLTLAASINDIGFMKWNSASIKKGTANGNINYIGFQNMSIDSLNIQGQLDQLKTDASNVIKFKEAANNQGFMDNVPFTINASAEYKIVGNEKQNIRLGMLFQSYNSSLYHWNELIAALTLKPFSWFTLSGTYDFLNMDYNRFGLALNFSPKWINLYIASDCVTPKLNPQYVPINKSTINISLGGSFVLGKPKGKDKDRDGVLDINDKCPDTPKGVKVDNFGCPIDTDGDGVPDYLDKCPDTPREAVGYVDKDGCLLDSDGDGVPDYLDKCKNTPAGVKVDSKGCPIDSDGDGVPDYLDKCPDTPKAAKGFVDKDGCLLDSDGDGVPDYLDLCQNTPKEAKGFVDKNGCVLDTDGDGVPDYLDKCPNTPIEARGKVDQNGCPRDTDGDGIPDYLDKCPTIPGVASNNGCPEIKTEVRTLFQKAMQGIQFETGKYIIKPVSFTLLNKIAKVLNENPTYLIEIQGHTDNVGKPEANLILSEKRAEAVRLYLTGIGISEKRMTSHGYGDTKPVETNNTKEGRALNRRVEFVVSFEEVSIK